MFNPRVFSCVCLTFQKLLFFSNYPFVSDFWSSVTAGRACGRSDFSPCGVLRLAVEQCRRGAGEPWKRVCVLQLLGAAF